jgi:hypothetical protein
MNVVRGLKLCLFRFSRNSGWLKRHWRSSHQQTSPTSIPLRLVAVGLDERFALLATVERRVACPETDYSAKRKLTHLKSVNTRAFPGTDRGLLIQV